MIIKTLKSRRGDISVMMILTILLSMLMIGTATAAITFKSLQSARVSNDAAEAFYLAEASLERKLVDLQFTMGANSVDRQCIIDCAASYVANGNVVQDIPYEGSSCQCRSQDEDELSYFGDTGRGETFQWYIMGESPSAAKIIPILRIDGGNYRVRRGIKAVINLPTRCPPLDVILLVSSDVLETDYIVSPINPIQGEPINRIPPTGDGSEIITRPDISSWYPNETRNVVTVNQGISAIVQKFIDNFNFANNRLLVINTSKWSYSGCQDYGDGCKYLGYDPAAEQSQGDPYNQVTDENINAIRDYIENSLGTTVGQGTNSGGGANLVTQLQSIVNGNAVRSVDRYGQSVKKVIIKIDDGKLARLPSNMATLTNVYDPNGCQPDTAKSSEWTAFLNNNDFHSFWIKVGSVGDIDTSCHAHPLSLYWYGSNDVRYNTNSIMNRGLGGLYNFHRCKTSDQNTGECLQWESATDALQSIYENIENAIHSSCTI